MDRTWRLEVCILNGGDEEWIFIDDFTNFDEATFIGEKYLSKPNHIDYAVMQNG
jgi:hypothetical protein